MAHLVSSIGVLEHVRQHTFQGSVNSDPELTRRQGRHLRCRPQALPCWPAVLLSTGSGACSSNEVLL